LAFEEMSHLGLLRLIIPELDRLRGCAQPIEFHQEGDVWTHTMSALDSLPPDAPLIARLATVFHDIGKPETFVLKERIRFDSHAEIGGEITSVIMKRLRFSAEQIESVTWCIKHHMMMADFLKMSDSRLMHWFHNSQMKNLIYLMKADASGTDPGDFTLYNKIEKLYRVKMRKMPKPLKPFLSGHEIMNLTGQKPGPKIKEYIQALLTAQIDGLVKNIKQAKKFIIAMINK